MVIVGAGQAGAQAAIAWDERNICMVLGHRVVEVDAARHAARTSSGLVIEYGSLIWAAGGRPHRLECAGGDLAGMHAICTRADVDALQNALSTTTNVAVVGGGYLGLEASALTELGKNVTVIEAADRVLARVAAEPLSRFFETEHRRRDVTLLLRRKVAEIRGMNGRAVAVELDDGTEVDCDMVIVGIGIAPNIEPSAVVGASIDRGITVDMGHRTNLQDVFAIGDCAVHPNRFAGGAAIRLESVQNANDQTTVCREAGGGTRRGI